MRPSSTSKSTNRCVRTRRDMMSQMVSAITNCCATTLQVSPIITSHTKGRRPRSSAELILAGICRHGNMGRNRSRNMAS